VNESTVPCDTLVLNTSASWEGHTGVATNAEEFGVLRSHLKLVKGEVWDGVLVDNVALVPVVGDTLPAFLVGEVTVFALNGKERLEHFAVQLALRVLLRLVRHEAVDEGVRSRLH
jgi:hypothetical protein